MVADHPPQSWLAPLRPAVVARGYRAAPPFAAGGHRSVLLRSSVGQAVRAPCGGVVTFRGTVAGSPPTVTVACGGLRSTVRWVRGDLGPGQLVGRGDAIGVATSARVGLSARLADGSYLDPLSLLGAAAHRAAPPVVPPRATRAQRRPLPPRAAPIHLPATAFAVTPAGSSSAAVAGPREGPRTRAGAATGSATPRPEVDWLLTGAGIAAVTLSLAGVGVSSLRRHRRHTRARRPGLAHLAALRR